jgi:hypothetical protein
MFSMKPRWSRTLCAAAACAVWAVGAQARPISFADGTTVMAEYGAGTMSEVQAFYAPSYRFSLGAGHLRLTSHVGTSAAGGGGHGHGGPVAGADEAEHGITYLRANYLPKRWNMEAAQANVFVWASVGQGRFGADGGLETAGNVGGQFDYETRRIYASLRTDFYEAPTIRHRIDTVQLGFAPYKHDYDRMALWFVVQARQYAGEALHDGTEVSALLRLFKRKAWIEAGVTQDGKIQSMLMFNF